MRNQVINYIKNRNCSPLEFIEYGYDSFYNVKFGEKIKIEDQELLSLDQLVLKVLDFTYLHASINSIESVETYRNKYRSVLDIWRHVIYYRPEVTIFDVMNSIYRNQIRLVGHYCTTINRRVFKLRSNETTSGLYPGGFDEFGLKFFEWENI